MTHEHESALLEAANLLAGYGLNVFACHDIDAAHAVIDHEEVAGIILSDSNSVKIRFLNERVVHHLKSYHPATPICSVNLQKNLGAQVVASFGVTLLAPGPHKGGEIGKVFHMKHFPCFLDNTKVATVFQPIVSLQRGHEPSVFGVEALTRIPWPGREETVNPEILFSYAANTGNIFNLDIMCMRAAFKTASKRPHQTLLFINIRPLSLINPKLFSEIAAFTGLFPNHRVVFELTEHETLPDLRVLVSAVERLKTLGFKLAIDDFGKGYANLNLLSLLRPNFVKISGLFADNLINCHKKQAIISSVLALSRTLGFDVVLETIDSEECAATAMALGISYAQGYHFGRPLSFG